MNRLLIAAAAAGFLLMGCKGHGSSSAAIPASLTNWTWEADTNAAQSPGSFGSLGVAATTNQPSGRSGTMGWKDSSGKLWIFSGSGGFSDMWVFDSSTLSWVWMSGTHISTSNAGVYGTQGTAAAANLPGARTSAATWTDAAGKFWMLGGYGTDANGLIGYMNDFWRYDTSSNQWTWMGGASGGGSSSGNYVYPAVNVAATSNIPNPRNSSAFWKDLNGNFWLFGGQAYLNNTGGLQNDLWEYIPANATWTLVGGSTTQNATGIYGTAATAASTNFPGARQQATTWTDTAGNFWLFGGSGYDSIGSVGYLNDLWKFSPTTQQWTWISGSNLINAVGVYGTNNVAAATNQPGARYGAQAWTDVSGNHWLFGGIGINSSGVQATMNDLWEFQASSNQWVWINGSYNGNLAGYYGTLHILSSSNMPGSRSDALTWTDATGNFWMFGGSGYDAASANGLLTDVWKFLP